MRQKELMMMTINKLLTPYNRTVKSSRSIKYIVVHYVGATGGAKANCIYYASKRIGASAHYYVGHNGEVWQSVLDKDIAWHSGGKKYVGTKGASHYGKCTNTNSISVELCCRANPWRFEKATIDTGVELVKMLAAKYSVPADRIIMHYDVTGKICAEPFVRVRSEWLAFKDRCCDGQAPVVPQAFSKGDALIADYQEALNDYHRRSLVVDGVYGPKTEAAAVVVRNGNQSELVKILQRLLSSRTNYFPGAWDSIFGRVTETAVREYQRRKGLEVDGIVGKKTWRALLLKQ